ncbi:hypothetical protein ACQP1P_15950 [Dactylosporangium sp. CA-052675]|uniref:hypothetical protein n=1 Tax=Dactylosporangium sp. CA-052675 TaxID=3239927 RepID=UPI003D8CE55B
MRVFDYDRAAPLALTHHDDAGTVTFDNGIGGRCLATLLVRPHRPRPLLHHLAVGATTTGASGRRAWPATRASGWTL